MLDMNQSKMRGAKTEYLTGFIGLHHRSRASSSLSSKVTRNKNALKVSNVYYPLGNMSGKISKNGWWCWTYPYAANGNQNKQNPVIGKDRETPRTLLKTAVQKFYRNFCFLSPSSDSDTVASKGEKDLSLTQHESLDHKDFERMWSEVYNPKDERFTEKVVVEMKVAATLDDFFVRFLSDGAPTSLARNHENTGDSDVECTLWESVEDISKKRRISYLHPIGTRVSMAPTACAATKMQIMRRFGDHGICVDTETYSKGIPLADCFYVMDRLLVASTTEGGVLVTIMFSNIFVKRTIFKAKISATSVKENSEFHRGFIELIRYTN